MLIYLQMIETPEDRDNFEAVYEAYSGLMYYVANQILENREDAEDTVHNAFLHIAKHPEKIRDGVCPKTKSYVVIITESRSIDVLRKRARQPETPLDEDITGLSADYTSLFGLSACISRLSPRYRHVLTLRYRYGYSIREIAEMMGLTLDTARKLEQRAKNRLQTLCKTEDIL